MLNQRFSAKPVDFNQHRQALKGMTILFVEDEQVVLEDGRSLLEKLFEKVYVAEDGVQGLERFIEFNPDMVLSDIRMPNMDGITMCSEIRKINIDTPLILLTAHSDEKHLMNAINSGVDAFLQKPMDHKKTIAAIMKQAKILRSRIDLEKHVMLAEAVVNLTPGFTFVLDHELNVLFSNNLVDKYFSDVYDLVGKMKVHIDNGDILSGLDLKNVADIQDGQYKSELDINGNSKGFKLQKRTLLEAGLQVFHLLT